MRTLLSIYILTLSSFCFGQNYELIETNDEQFYKIIKDSINLDLNYPDGRYKVFITDTNKLPIYTFYLKYGFVNGPYSKLTPSEWTYGNYAQDSLWTFITAPEDTTFKIGTWRNRVYALGYNTDNHYKIPFDSSDKFTEVWRYSNGHKFREAVFKKGFGLKKETYWDFETNRILKQTINSGTKNYYQSIIYEDDSISYVSLVQNGFEVTINFDYSLCDKRPCMEVNVFSDHWESYDRPMASISIDSTKTLTHFDDIKRQISLSEDEDGNIKIRYQNKKGKEKYKKLKIN